MIGLGQAEYLIWFAENNGYYGVVKELKRIGAVGLSKYVGLDQKRRLYHYMFSNNPTQALKLLKLMPSKDDNIENGNKEL